jgi:hypothetical protein
MYPVGAIDPDSSYWNTGTFGSGYLLTLSLDPNGTLWLFDQNSAYTDVLFLANRLLLMLPQTDDRASSI